MHSVQYQVYENVTHEKIKHEKIKGTNYTIRFMRLSLTSRINADFFLKWLSFFPVLLIYNRHATLYKFKVYS